MIIAILYAVAVTVCFFVVFNRCKNLKQQVEDIEKYTRNKTISDLAERFRAEAYWFSGSKDAYYLLNAMANYLLENEFWFTSSVREEWNRLRQENSEKL